MSGTIQIEDAAKLSETLSIATEGVNVDTTGWWNNIGNVELSMPLKDWKKEGYANVKQLLAEAGYKYKKGEKPTDTTRMGRYEMQSEKGVVKLTVIWEVNQWQRIYALHLRGQMPLGLAEEIAKRVGA